MQLSSCRSVFKRCRLALIMLFLVVQMTTTAQQRITVHGKVLSDEKAPMMGVSVKLIGTTLGTVTDSAGTFLLAIPMQRGELEFSSVGYLTQKLSFKGDKPIEVQMTPELQSLNEVVVVGYGRQKKKDLTGAIAGITSKELEYRPVLRADQMLQGRLPGVDVKSVNGAPGAGTSIRIRGARSINASNEPLYVIDGLVGVGDLNSLNPDDIATIDVLKDASATAIYGSRGANGVILITTKRGKEGQDNVSVNYNIGVGRLPEDRKPALLNAPEFVQFIKDAREDLLSGAALENDKQYKYVNSINLDSIGNGTDWFDAVSRSAPFSNLNVSVNGGTEKLKYYLSGNYADQEGIILGSGFKRYQLRLNLDKQLGKIAKIGTQINLSRSITQNTNVNFSNWWNSVSTLSPTFPVYNPDGSYYSNGIFQYAGGANFNSPVALGNLIKDNTVTTNLTANIYVDLAITKDLHFQSNLGTLFNMNRDNYYSPTNMPANIADGFKTGSATVNDATHDYLLSSNTLNYDHAFGKHHLNMVAGATYQKDVYEGLSGSGKGFLNDIYEWNNLGVVEQDQKDVGSSYSTTTIISFLGRINYNYNNKYYLTVTGRNDGASNFAKNRKWGFFPSTALKWRLSEEPFIKRLNLFQDLGLRASYGVAGNQGISAYSSLPKLNVDETAYIFGNLPTLGYYSGALANNNLTWETSGQFNVGLEMSILKGRLSLDANYYHTNTSNLLLNVQIASQTGYSSILENLGKTTSKGFEFSIKSVNIQSPNFSWRTNLNLSTNQQEIVDLGPLVKVATDNNGYGGVTTYYEVGVPLGALYGAYYGGTWKSQAEIDAEQAKPAGSRDFVSTAANYRPGRMKYKDLNHDGELNESDMPFLATPNPKLYGSIENTFTYKNWDLTFVFNGNSGNKMYNNQMFFMGNGTGGGVYTNQFALFKDHWNATRNPDSDIPGPNSRDNVPSTYLLQDASFLRLNSVVLGYNLPGSKMPGHWMKNAYIYFSGSNLWLLSDYIGFDPEVNASGTSSTVRAKDAGVYPNSRTYTLGLKINF